MNDTHTPTTTNTQPTTHPAVPTRRQFIQHGAAAATVAMTAMHVPHVFAAATPRRRYAIIGTGVRGTNMWGKDLVKRYPDILEFVGLCDINPKRVVAAKEMMGVDCPVFTDFNELVAKAKPELLTITTVDAFHQKYICDALDRGLDVLTEKPMVINEEQCRQVLEAEKRTGKKITVTFNYRYAPKHQQIKEIILSGAIGRVMSVDFSWYLDTSHGADYFRRWHRLRRCSGSLLVHKASHHYDLVNWWLGAEPVEVKGRGELSFYGKKGPFRNDKCRGCAHKSECKFYWDITKNKSDVKLYCDAEDVDGYFRDGCVFREDCDIFDSMGALVNYSNGTTMTYSLNAFLPIEGYRIAFNGDQGRLEVRDFERQPWKVEAETEIALTKLFGTHEKLAVNQGTGGHGGGDNVMRDVIFRNAEVPPYMRLPDSRAGAMACLTGIAARKSIDGGTPIRIADLLGT